MPYAPGKRYGSPRWFTSELIPSQVTLLRVLVSSRRDALNVTLLRLVDPTRLDPTYTGESRFTLLANPRS